MSGGSYDRAFDKVLEVAEALSVERDLHGAPVETLTEETTPLRHRFARHLRLVAEAMRAIEWVDSYDDSPGDEAEAIKAVFGEGPWARDERRHKDGSRCEAASPAECGRAHLMRGRVGR